MTNFLTTCASLFYTSTETHDQTYQPLTPTLPTIAQSFSQHFGLLISCAHSRPVDPLYVHPLSARLYMQCLSEF